MYRQLPEEPNEQLERRRLPKWWRALSVIVIALAFGVLMRATLLLAAPSAAPAAANLAQSVPADDDEYVITFGIIVTRPDGVVGTWVVSGESEVSFSVTEVTDIEGELPVGACVEVKSLESDPTVALKIRAKDAHHCDEEDEDDHEELSITYGIIVTRPEGTLGTWVISNSVAMSFTALESTLVEGELAVGACVAVKWFASEPTIAVKILEQDAHKCGDDDDDDDEHEHDEFIVRVGEIVTRPVEDVGVWVIGEKSFTVTESTVLEGVLEVGACVEVKALASDPTIAIKISAKDAYKCGNDDDDDEDDDDHEHGRKIINYGILSSRPEGKVGIWVIGGESYSATLRTELEHDHGRLVPGVCAKVEVRAGAPRIALEIESEKDYKCHRDDKHDAYAVLFGVIEELPPNLQDGIWVIGGISFTVTPETELISKGVPFSEGLVVKVQFSTNISDTNYARRIEFKFGHNNPCRDFDHASATAAHNGGDKHRFFGYCPGREGRAVGIIDDRPEGTLLGNWIIGGMPYSATAHTEFYGQDFLVGARVKVEYVVLNDETRLATKIKKMDTGDPNASLFAGTVISKPEAFVGWWNIGGGDFEAISTTVFIERGSLFAVGAYVVVDYEIVDNRRLIHKILTYVPPGAGDDNQVGILQSMGGAVIANADVVLQSDEVWTIGGVDYIVSEATQLVDSGGEMVEGAVVHVNSYTDNGQRYATMIRTQGGKAFIPMAAR